MLVRAYSCSLTCGDWNMKDSKSATVRRLADGARRSNVDRLRVHLKPASLASRLFDAWSAGAAADATGRMRAVLDAPTETTEETDAAASSPQA